MTYNYYHSSLDDINALDFIRSLENPPMVIFVTAYPEYAVDSYKVNAVDYLLKPYGSEDFQHTAEKAYKHWQLMNSTKVAEQENTEKNVLYLKIHLRAGGPFLTHMTFKQISESLPENFIQIHRSYIVNMKHVASAERTLVVLDDGTRLPVSDTRRSVLLDYINMVK